MYKRIVQLFHENSIDFEEYNHEPVLSYEKAEEIRNQYGFSGVESKSLFLKGKSGKYFVFITTEGVKLDTKKVKKIIGEKVSICSGEELTQATGCVPGCVSPIGYDEDVSFIVDENVFNHDKIIFSPGVPEMTMVISGDDFRKVFQIVTNRIYKYEAD